MASVVSDIIGLGSGDLGFGLKTKAKVTGVCGRLGSLVWMLVFFCSGTVLQLQQVLGTKATISVSVVCSQSACVQYLDYLYH